MNWSHFNTLLDSSQHILLTTHENPDGDGLGCSVAMYYHLTAIGKQCRIINHSVLPAEYGFLDQDGIFEHYEADNHNPWLQNCDLAIIFDVGDYCRLKQIKNVIERLNIDTVNIDHHPHPDENPYTLNIINVAAAATGSIVYDYLKAHEPLPLSKKICTGIYTAIMTDTGSFRHSNTDIHSHEVAIVCMQAGVNTSEIYQRVYESKPQRSVRLLARVIDNIRFENNGELAWFTIDQKMLDAVGATAADVDGFTDFVRTINGVEVAIMIFDNGQNMCRVNFRSKGKYIINDIAHDFGGGGHKFAAGFIIKGSNTEVAPQVVAKTNTSITNQKG